MREFFARVWDWMRRDRLDAELAEELRFHREQLERDRRAEGDSPGVATDGARRQLGNATSIREHARDRWSIPWFDHLLHDVRYALRTLRRSPGFSVAVTVTLALGIGANVAMFNVIDQAMFRPYAFLRDPSTVHRVYLRVPGGQRLLNRESFPYARYLDLRAWTSSFSQSAAFYPTTVAIGNGVATRERPIAAVSASFWDFFAARPALGRFFTASEDAIPVGAPVAVLSYEYWQAEFGGRDILGQTVRINNVVCSIIGVAPDGFTGVADATPPSIYIPMTTFGGHEPGGSSKEYWQRYAWDWAEMMVRRKAGVTVEQASADLTQAYRRSRDQARLVHSWMPRTDMSPPIATAGALKTAAGPYAGREAQTLLSVMTVAAIVLLIACANVANLFLVRATQRRRDVALRVALGVSRSRLVVQSLTEGLVLSSVGGVLGITLARAGAVVLRQLALSENVVVDNVSDWRTLAVALGAAVGAGIVTSLAPLALTQPTELSSTLKSGAREGTYQRSRLRSILLVAQGALSVVLLVGAGLFVRSLDRLQATRIGVDVDPVLLVHWDRRGEEMNDSARMALRRRLLDVARGIGGVERAAWVSNVPLQGTSIMHIAVPGVDRIGELGRFTYQSATTDYFGAIGTRILRGRGFTDADRAGAPRAAVVSATMARALWPAGDALGKCIRVGADSAPCTTVVGIAEDAMHHPVNDEPMRYYLPMEQFPNEGGSLLVLRMRGTVAARLESVRRTLQEVMPGEQFVTTEPLTKLYDGQRQSWRVGATMFASFGILALLVAAVGLYAVISHNVTQRLHEVGVRMALGARARDVLQLVIGEGIRLVLLGVAAGLAVALAASPWIQPLLYQQSATDVGVYGVTALLLIVTAMLATSFPAWRATRTDPNVVLRSE